MKLAGPGFVLLPFLSWVGGTQARGIPPWTLLIPAWGWGANRWTTVHRHWNQGANQGSSILLCPCLLPDHRWRPASSYCHILPPFCLLEGTSLSLEGLIVKGLVSICLSGDVILLEPSMLWMSFKSVQVIYSSASKMTGTVSQMKRLSQIPGVLWKPLSLKTGEKGWTFYWGSLYEYENKDQGMMFLFPEMRTSHPGHFAQVSELSLFLFKESYRWMMEGNAFLPQGFLYSKQCPMNM